MNSKAYAKKKFLDIDGYRMAYIDEGEGDAIVFQHGNPTSSYLWRNVMPHCEGLGRLVACDLIGMGDSEKLKPSGPNRYLFAEQQHFLYALWNKLNLGNRVILVLHDWGSSLGFEWARQHPERVQGIAYMESIVRGITFDSTANRGGAANAIRSAEGERLMLQENAYVEARLPASIMRKLSEDEMNEYRRPFLNAGEDRRPTLSWPRQFPVNGEPTDVAATVDNYARWLQHSNIPKLFINAEPGILLKDETREFCRTWPNQTEVTVKGLHFIQEDSPDEIGAALKTFITRLRI